jgi:RNA polymerase sigma-70 factor, ECF subfamily
LVLSEIKRWRLVPSSANGQPTLAGYLWDTPADAFTPYCLCVLSVRSGQIAEITAFVTPEIFQPFGLPSSIPR